MSNIDTKQEGGRHYKECPPEFQHWNLVLIHNWDYFQAQVIKYVMRYKKKNGLEDLKKAKHFLEKIMESFQQLPETAEPKVADFYQYVKPTGWVGFVFEGARQEGFLYTCQKCGEKVSAKAFQPPWEIHDANACPDGKYTNQG